MGCRGPRTTWCDCLNFAFDWLGVNACCCWTRLSIAWKELHRHCDAVRKRNQPSGFQLPSCGVSIISIITV